MKACKITRARLKTLLRLEPSRALGTHIGLVLVLCAPCFLHTPSHTLNLAHAEQMPARKLGSRRSSAGSRRRRLPPRWVTFFTRPRSEPRAQRALHLRRYLCTRCPRAAESSHKTPRRQHKCCAASDVLSPGWTGPWGSPARIWSKRRASAVSIPADLRIPRAVSQLSRPTSRARWFSRPRPRSTVTAPPTRGRLGSARGKAFPRGQSIRGACKNSSRTRFCG